MSASSPLHDRRWHSRRLKGRGLKTGLTLTLLAAMTLGCGGPRQGSGGKELGSEALSAQQRALKQCLNLRDRLHSQLRELRQAERTLARLRTAPMPPTPGRPIWDEEKERRYSQEDQEIDHQQYLSELAAWRERDQARWDAWQQRRTPDIGAAQQRLNQLSRQLHQSHPVLFTGPGSIEVRSEELARLSRCDGSPQGRAASAH